MDVVPWSRGTCRTHKDLRGMGILTLLLLMVVGQTNSDKYESWNYGRNTLTRNMMANINKLNERFTLIEKSLTAMQKEIQIIRNFTNTQETGEGSCPAPFLPINTTGECIIIAKTSATYKEANDKCALIGAHLAVPKELRYLEDFMIDKEYSPSLSGLSRDTFWIGANNILPPHLWCWVDGRPVDALTLLYNFAPGRINELYSTHNYCGALHLGMVENDNLLAIKCEGPERYPFICEIEPGSEINNIEFQFETICPENYVELRVGECVYISPAEEFLNYTEAVTFCAEQGATLLNPKNLTFLINFLADQLFIIPSSEDPFMHAPHRYGPDTVFEYGLWLSKQVRFIDQRWNDRLERPSHPSEDSNADSDLCTLFQITSHPLRPGAYFYKDVASCSSHQRFMCSLNGKTNF